jgi:hypothetical protein
MIHQAIPKLPKTASYDEFLTAITFLCVFISSDDIVGHKVAVQVNKWPAGIVFADLKKGQRAQTTFTMMCYIAGVTLKNVPARCEVATDYFMQLLGEVCKFVRKEKKFDRFAVDVIADAIEDTIEAYVS